MIRLTLAALLLSGCAVNAYAEAPVSTLVTAEAAIQYEPTPEPQNRPVEAPEPFIIDITDQLEHPAVRYDVWVEIVAAFGAEHADCAAIIAWRESRLKHDLPPHLDTNGHYSEGMFQVQSVWFGPVPADRNGQIEQAARIHREVGWQPWSGTRGAC